MKSVRQLFDKYSFSARVKPAFYLAAPLVLTVIVWFEESRSWGGASLTFLTSFGIITFAANQLSTFGNRLQDKLYKKWGGAPTTIILRHTDSRIDRYTKERYMQYLSGKISNFRVVTAEKEKADPLDADELYKSASRYLREKTRDRAKYPLVFEENINYGFSRNLYAAKPLGVTITLGSLCINLYYIWKTCFANIERFSIKCVMSIPFVKLGTTAIICFALFMWLYYVNENWVKVRGFRYARALFAPCEESVDVRT